MRAQRRRLAAACSALLRRLGMAWLTLWLLSSTVFLSLRLLPGDPAELVLGDRASEEDRRVLRHKLHLDRSLSEQFVGYQLALMRLDGGPSIRRPSENAFKVVLASFPETAKLASLGVLLGSLAGVSAGVCATGPFLALGFRSALHRATVAVGAIPLLALAPVATLLLTIRLHWLPLPGDPGSGLAGALFAASLLAIPLCTQVARITRASLLQIRDKPFLQVALAKGGSRWRVWFLHALPVASAPILTLIGTQLGALLGGAVILERLFERPGLGTVILEAYAARDLTVLQAGVVASGALFVLAQGAVSVLLTAVHVQYGDE